jgi:hypothetical protein
MLKGHCWPPMDADERGLKDAKAFVSDPRLSAFIGGVACYSIL